jgi:glycosidase
MGFKVIIDWVANHTGWDHKWTREHPEWFLKDSATNDFQIASGMEDIIELDFKNTQMRKAMIDAMKFWVTESDIDGFRADLAFWVELDFWLEAKKELDQVKPMLWLAEADPLEHPEYMQVFDAAYTWTWMHKTKEFYQNQLPVSALDSVLERYEQAPGIKAWFTTNHDENSWNGTEYEKYGEMAIPLAVFSCTWKGLPLIYSGQELPNKKRLEFFQRDSIAWTGNPGLHDFYKTLLILHSSHPALSTDAPVKRIRTTSPEIFAFLRKEGEKEVLVLLNFSGKDQRFDLTDPSVSGNYRNAFSNAENDFTNEKSFEMKAWGYLVYQR